MLITGHRHRVPKHAMMENNCVAQVDSDVLPDVDSAVIKFESNGGQLTTFSSFGENPLRHNPVLISQREEQFYRQHPKASFANFFILLQMETIHCFVQNLL